MPPKSRTYAKLLRTAQMLKARDEAQLAATKRDIDALAQENITLYAMMGHQNPGCTVFPALIAKRIDNNHRLHDKYSSQQEAQIHNLLQSSRRHDRMEKKYQTLKKEEERKILSLFLEEYINKATNVD